MSKPLPQFREAMKLLRRVADVGPAQGPHLPKHIRASASLALWVERLEDVRKRRAPRHIIEHAERAVDRYRKEVRASAA